MKLSKMKNLKTDFECCLSNVPEPSEFVHSEIGNGEDLWSYECNKGGFLYLLGTKETEGDKIDYCAVGFAIKECDISAEHYCYIGLTPDGEVIKRRSITDTDKNNIVCVSLSYRDEECWSRKDVLDEMKDQLRYNIDEVKKKIEKAEAQKTQ